MIDLQVTNYIVIISAWSDTNNVTILGPPPIQAPDTIETGMHPITGPRPITANAWAVALGLWIFIDLQRVWAPSLITIFGQAASTPAELMGAYALGCIAIALIPLLLFRQRHTRVALLGAMTIMAATRVALQFTDGGDPQLWIASLGIAAGVTWLALAAQSYGRDVVAGVAVGLALSTITHAALGTWGAIWRHDAWAYVLLAVQLIGLLLAHRHSQASKPLGARACWLLFPLLLLTGIAFANAGRASAVAGGVGLVGVSVGAILGIWAAGLVVRRTSVAIAMVVFIIAAALVLGVEVTVNQVPGVSPRWVLPAYVFGLPAAIHLLAAAARGKSGSSLRVAGGAVIWVLLFFAYYAGYDLGYHADSLMVIVALILGILAASTNGASPRRPTYSPALISCAVVAAVITAWFGPGLTTAPVSASSASNPATLTFATYNLRMGYGMNGRFDPRGVAQVLRGADVIVLSEIDRGWLLNGGQDQLRILAQLLDMHMAFGPAADPVWGDAILSRHKLHDIRGEAFERYGAVTGAEVLSATINVGDKKIAIISTHLQPGNAKTNGTVRQAKELAKIMRARAAGHDGAVLGGDLNTTPASAAWTELLTSGYVDALASDRPMLTSPADHPVESIDHVFVTPGLGVRKAYTKKTEYSDHLPVFAELQVSD